MSYVTLHPHSNTNPTDKFWVVDYNDWELCVNNDCIERISPMRDFEHFGDAEAFRDTANHNAEEEDYPDDCL